MAWGDMVNVTASEHAAELFFQRIVWKWGSREYVLAVAPYAWVCIDVCAVRQGYRLASKSSGFVDVSSLDDVLPLPNKGSIFRLKARTLVCVSHTLETSAAECWFTKTHVSFTGVESITGLAHQPAKRFERQVKRQENEIHGARYNRYIVVSEWGWMAGVLNITKPFAWLLSMRRQTTIISSSPTVRASSIGIRNAAVNIRSHNLFCS